MSLFEKRRKRRLGHNNPARSPCLNRDVVVAVTSDLFSKVIGRIFNLTFPVVVRRIQHVCHSLQRGSFRISKQFNVVVPLAAGCLERWFASSVELKTRVNVKLAYTHANAPPISAGSSQEALCASTS